MNARRLARISGSSRVHLALAAVCCAVAFGGCDDPPLNENPGTSDSSGYGDIAGGEVVGGDGTATEDSSAAVDTALPDDGAASDTLADGSATTADGTADSAADTGQVIDAGPNDASVAPFEVLSHAPATGSHGHDRKFSFSVTFNRDVKAASIQPMTVLVRSNGGKPISGVFKTSGAVVTFDTQSPAPPSSRIDVTFTILVQGQLPGSLTQPYTFHFYTKGFEDTEAYAALAGRYAPDIRQGTAGTGKADQLRAIDYDGNWDSEDNISNQSKKPALGSIT